MSRSFVRSLAGLAVVALLPLSAQAQNSCTITPSNPSPCAVDLDMTLTIPTLAYLNIPVTTLAFPTPDWDAFLAAPAATTTVTSTQLTIRTNSSYTVQLLSSGWDAAWTNGDVRFGTNAAACTLPAQVPTTLAASQGLTLTGGGVPTNSYQQFLCLGLVFPADLTDARLSPDTYTLGLQVQITAP